jgi:hypothetical protein
VETDREQGGLFVDRAVHNNAVSTRRHNDSRLLRESPSGGAKSLIDKRETKTKISQPILIELAKAPLNARL